MHDAIGYDPFFTFDAAPEVKYAAISLPTIDDETSAYVAINDRGTVILENLEEQQFQIYSDGVLSEPIDGVFAVLNNNDEIAYTTPGEPTKVKIRGVDGTVSVRDYTTIAEENFGKTGVINDYDTPLPHYGDLQHQISASVEVISLSDSGSLHVKLLGSYDCDYLLGEDRARNVTTDLYIELIGYSKLVDTAYTHVDYFEGAFWGESGLKTHSQLHDEYDLDYEVRDALHYTYDPWTRTSHQIYWTNFSDTKDGRIRLTTDFYYDPEDPVEYEPTEKVWNFDDGTTVRHPSEDEDHHYFDTSNSSSEPRVTWTGSLPGDKYLWKKWETPTGIFFSKRGPDSGSKIYTDPTKEEELYAGLSRNGTTVRSVGLWRNGRTIPSEKLLADLDPSMQAYFRKRSPSGELILGYIFDGTDRTYKLLLPFEVAPDVLRVNSDFDKQKVDTATGYAKPDNEDEDLKAERGDDQGKIVTEDLHKGFWGVNPNTLPPAFYTGATVTINKKPETDDDTGEVEEGTIRIYAIENFGETNEQSHSIPISEGEEPSISSDNPRNLANGVYGPNAPTPRGDGVTY